MKPVTAVENSQFRLTQLIAVVLLILAPLIYLFIANSITRDPFEADEQVKLIMYLLIPIALIDPALWFIVRRSMIKSVTQKRSDQSPAKHYFSMSLVKLSLVAAIYVYGLVAFFLTNEIMNMIWFYPIGVVWSIVFWPKRSQFERVMNEGLEVL